MISLAFTERDPRLIIRQAVKLLHPSSPYRQCIEMVIALADAFDAMTHDRPYKRGIAPERALEVVESERGGHFDPQVVDAFVRVFPTLPTTLA
jgi:hypothetical protein